MNRQEQIVMEYMDSHRGEMLALWEKLVNTDSPTADKAAVERVGAILYRELEKAGAAVRFEEVQNRGNILYAELGTENPGKPVIFCGHMDTVFAPGEAEKRPFRIENGRAYGPGVLDMKAGLVIAVFVLRALAEAGYDRRPIRVIFLGDEEGGHRQSDAREILPRLAEGAGAAFNFETGRTNEDIIISRKGSCRFSLDVTGVAAHAGNCPEKGRNAILETAHKVIALQALNDLPHGTSLNVGVIGGGTVVNAVPDRCHIDVDVRYTEKARLDALLREVEKIAAATFVEGCGTKLTMQPASVVMEEKGNRGLFEHIRRTALDIGYGEIRPASSGGWSDSNLLSSYGIPVVCSLGVKGEENHTPFEYALVDSLFERAKLAAVSVLRLPDGEL